MRSITHAIERRFIALVIGTMWVAAHSPGLAGQVSTTPAAEAARSGTSRAWCG